MHKKHGRTTAPSKKEEMTKKFGFIPIPHWEYEIVLQDGIFNSGGVCIFLEKEEAMKFGEKVCRINLPKEYRDMEIDGQMQVIPIMEEFDSFFLCSIDVDLANEYFNQEAELIADEDLPMLWFTKERIPALCIINSEKIPL